MHDISDIHAAIETALLNAGMPLAADEWQSKIDLELWSKAYKVKAVPVLALKADPSELTLPPDAIPTVALRLAIAANACHQLSPSVRMRVIGHHDERWGEVQNPTRDERDLLHNWSPINLDRDAANNAQPDQSEILYLSFQYISHDALAVAAAPPGGPSTPTDVLSFWVDATDPDLAYLRSYCGDSMRSVARRAHLQGFTPPILPAPDVLSLGGVLAIGGHGSRMSSSLAEQDAGGNARNWAGSISTSVDSATVICWDTTTGQYEAKRFDRASDQLPFIAASLGRVIVVDATLRVMKDYCLDLEFKAKKTSHIFGNNAAHADSLDSLAGAGGYEVLAFRPGVFTSKANRKAHVVQWTQSLADPATVGWPTNRDHALSGLIANGGVPQGIIRFLPWWLMMFFARRHADGVAADIAARRAPNGQTAIPYTAGDQRMYAHSDVTPIEASSWAVLVPKTQLQDAGRAMYDIAMDSLAPTKIGLGWWSHRHMAFECRSANLDDLALPANAKIPNLSMAAPYVDPVSGTTYDSSTHMVLWVSILYLVTKRTQATHGNYQRVVEEAINTKCDQEGWILRPEWAKGWGYTDAGGWNKDAAWIQTWLEKAWPGSANDVGSWRHACALAKELDPHGIFNSPFHEKLLPTP